MIYGATGYTGRLACDHAKRIGLDFMIAGRNEAKLKSLAARLSVPHCTFDISDDSALADNIDDVLVLLNIAGPFSRTAKALMKACIHKGVHYLDTSAELISYQLAEQYSDEARKANVMLLPGCGGSVAMFSCLTAFAIQKHGLARDIKSVDIALQISGGMSQGSMKSAAEAVTNVCFELRDGILAKVAPENKRSFHFGKGGGPVECLQITLPDLITVAKSSGILNIRCFFNVTEPTPSTESHPDDIDGPSPQTRDANPYQAAVRLVPEDGHEEHAVLHTVNGYTFTYIASVEAARRVLVGQAVAGFQTPVEVFGVDFVGSVPGSVMLSV